MAGEPPSSLALVSRLLDTLDQAAAKYTGIERRTQVRLPYRRGRVPIQITHVGGGSFTGMATTRNLAPGGASVMVRCFVHDHSEAAVQLAPVSGPPMRVTGRSVACRYVSGGLHEVSVAFAQKVELTALLSPAERAGAERHGERVRRRLDGVRMLYIGVAGTRAEEVVTTLQDVGSEAVVATYSGEALDAVRRQNFDLVLCEPQARNIRGKDLVPMLRLAGYAGPVMAVGWSAEDLVSARSSPNAGVISAVELCDADQLLNVLPVRAPRPEPARPGCTR